jgi:hypothetical protein
MSDKRNVVFRKRIPMQYETKPENGYSTPIPGTGCYSEWIYAGVFHEWGVSYEEYDNGPGNFTVGLVEMPDGTIEEVVPSNIKFTS